jgi:hypothetical protein
LCRFPSFLNHLDLWFNPERFELGCETFGPLAFLFGPLAFLFGLLVFLLSPQAFLLSAQAFSLY